MTQLQLGLERQREGLSRVEANNKYFIERMREKARQVCAEKGFVTTDDLREWGLAAGILPQSMQAWGGILIRPHFLCLRRVTSRYKTNNGRQIGVYIPSVGV